MPDTDLIRLADAVIDAHARWVAACEAGHADLMATVPEGFHADAGRLAAMPAGTLAGYRAKARAALALAGEGDPDGPQADDVTSLAFAVLRDLAG